jgi:uncharacterized protein (DUF2062 family)
MPKLGMDGLIGRKQQANRSQGCQPEERAEPGRRSWGARLWRRGRAIYLRLVRQNSNPDKMAKGLALGAFLGILPTFGAGSALALLASSWLRWNRVGAVLGTFIANPLLNPLFLSLSVIAGNLVMPENFRIALETFRQGDWGPRLTFCRPISLEICSCRCCLRQWLMRRA